MLTMSAQPSDQQLKSAVVLCVLALLVLLALVAVSCGDGSPTRPSPPPAQPVQETCPPGQHETVVVSGTRAILVCVPD